MQQFDYLQMYIGNDFSRRINPYLRNLDGSDKELEIAKDEINSKLNSCNAFNNNVTYKMDRPYSGLSFDLFALWFEERIEEIIEFPCFLSTTFNPDRCFIGQHRLFEIHTNNNSNGKDVSKVVNGGADEAEVLFKANSKFKIEKIKYAEEMIVLIEVGSQTLTNHILINEYYKENDDIRKELEPAKNIYRLDI